MGDGRAVEAVPAPERPEWYGVREAAAILGVTRQTVHERVHKLQGAEKVDGRWRIPREVVEALVTSERAKALASGSVVMLPTGEEREPAPHRVGDLADRVTQLERAFADQSLRHAEQLADREARIEELRADRRRLRQALRVFMEASGHLVADDE